MPVNFKELLKLLNNVRDLVDSPNTDITWSRYDSVSEVLLQLDILIEMIERNDLSVLSKLKLLFAPTSALQEISISSGWGNKLSRITNEFDEIVGNS